MADLLHALPADDWAAPRRLARAYPDGCDRLAFLLIRPDAVVQGLVLPILERAARCGLRVADALVIRPHARQLEELYRYTQVQMMAAGSRPMWWYTPRYYQLAPAVVTLLEAGPGGPPAAEALAAVKGPSNPALTRPGQLRFDFGSQNMVMCLVHSSDSAESALREACLFFGELRVAGVLSRAGQGQPAPDVAALLAGHGLPARAAPRPTFHQAVARLQAAILEGPAVQGDPDLARPGRDMAAVLRQACQADLAHPRYQARTEALLSAWRAHGTGLLRLAAGRQDDELAFLTWSAALEDTICAYADGVLARLRERGHAIDPWTEILLETGWGFHDLIDQGAQPTAGDAALARADFAEGCPAT